MKKAIVIILAVTVMLLPVLTTCAETVTEAPDAASKTGIYYHGGFAYNIPEKTAPSALTALEPGLSVVSAAGNYVGTGAQLSFRGKTYQAVIYGDPSGDGQVTATDYTMAKRTFMETYTPSAAAYEAMKDGDTLSVTDYIKIKRHVLGTYDLFASPHKDYDGPGASPVKIAYIPLDNRPVNKDRAEYLAASAGFELLMPEESLYRTALDNMDPNPDGSTLGNRQALLDWLRSIRDECDYYVISLDQMFSGGLVGSRYLSNTDLTFEYEIADYLIGLSKDKCTVYFDTVMRLASTVGYMGYDLDTYNKLRAYGATARNTLTGSDLTVENIIAGYRYGENGRTISVSVSSDVLDRYLASRTRKLRLIDRVLAEASRDIERIYVGVDDSSPQNTIQTNEINYITAHGGDNLTLFAGADELGLMGIAAVSSIVYGPIDVSVSYFGTGKDLAADDYDIGTLASNLEKHIEAIGANLVGNVNSDNLRVLVLTKPGNESDAVRLCNTLLYYLGQGIPVCVIDASCNGGVLQRKMLSLDTDNYISRMLGYSSWNTVGNAIGISLSNAAARYAYLISAAGEPTLESNDAFTKTLTFSLVKDISYIISHGRSVSNPSGFFNEYGELGARTIIDKINNSDMISGYGRITYHGFVTCSNLRYPWNRTFEATFDIEVRVWTG